MNVRDLERTVIDQWVRLVRFPIDAGARMVPNGDGGPRSGLLLAIDRADATVRNTLGRFLNHDELQDDARRRHAAADERARAIELRVEAERCKLEAAEQLARRQDSAEELREQAARTAAERERQAEQQRQQSKRRAQQTAENQKSVVAHVHAEKEHAGEQKAKHERLRVLDQQAEALDTKTDALTASDEAQRLANEAAKAKAARKGTAQSP